MAVRTGVPSSLPVGMSTSQPATVIKIQEDLPICDFLETRASGCCLQGFLATNRPVVTVHYACHYYFGVPVSVIESPFCVLLRSMHTV